MTTVELLTPFGPVSDVVELAKSGLFRKQILRFGTINYRAPDGSTRKIDFDREYGEDLIRSFQDGAYDQVTFQLATADNRHNNLPERTGGEIVGVELSADGSGLDGVFRLWGNGRRAVDLNKKLGVSARIIENLSHSDGRTYPRALQHVLGTVDPQITGMRPWEKVELSNESAGERVDLSDQNYGRGEMPETTTEDKPDQLSAEELTALRELLADNQALAGLAEQLPEGFLDEDPEDDEDEDENSGAELAETALSGAAGEAIELANAQLASQEARIVELTRQTNEARVSAEVEVWRGRGLAPAVLDKARALLAVPAGAVELSNGVGDTVDPGEAVRELIETVVDLASTGHLLLDDDDEVGSLSGEKGKNTERDAMLNAWRAEYPS